MRRRVEVRPGKGASLLGFVVGLIFCGIGLLITIPNFGPFGIFWTLIAAFITASNALNAFTDKGPVSQVIEVDEDELPTGNNAAAQAGQTADAVKARLDAARQLYEDGTITRDEYDRKRQQILDEM